MLRSLQKASVWLIVCILSMQVYAGQTRALGEPDTPVIITGFQVASTKEYIEIYNRSSLDVSLEGWKLAYANTSGSNNKTIALLEGTLGAHEMVVWASSDYIQQYSEPDYQYKMMLYSGLADSGGSITLMKSSPENPQEIALQDKVSWTSSSALASSLILNMSGAKSAKRCTDHTGVYSTRADISSNFDIIDTPSAYKKASVCSDLVIVPEDPVEDSDNEIIELPTEDPVEEITEPDNNGEHAPIVCAGIMISELLPNPAGIDSGLEFIELFNGSENSVDINNCTIELAESERVFNPPQYVMHPGEYRVFYDDYYGFSLPNSSGGKIAVINEYGEEVSSTEYPEDLDDDVAWVIAGSSYSTSYTSTPGLQNIVTTIKPCNEGYVRNLDTNRCQLVKQNIIEPVQCSAGMELNPDTGKCRKVAQPIRYTPCPEGQERNPTTNRCKSLIAVASVVVPCPTGQYRNPETNRCKTTEIVSVLSGCPEGQQRNPETNRCRTIQPIKEIEPQVLDVYSNNSSSRNWTPGIALAAGVFAYSAYEWRDNIRRRIHKIYALFKLKKNKPV